MVLPCLSLNPAAGEKDVAVNYHSQHFVCKSFPVKSNFVLLKTHHDQTMLRSKGLCAPNATVYKVAVKILRNSWTTKLLQWLHCVFPLYIYSAERLQ